MDSIEAE